MGFLDLFRKKPAEANPALGAFQLYALADLHPHLLVVCTDRDASEFTGVEEMRWLKDNRNVLIGTLLGLEEPDEIRDRVAAWEASGFNTQVLAGVDPHSLASGHMEEAAAYLEMAGRDPADFQSLTFAMADIYEKTQVIQFCWFFEKS